LISGHRSRSDSPDALMYGFSEKLGSSEMILGASGSPEDRSADNRMACKTYLSDSEDQRLLSEHGLGLVSMITHSGSVIIAMFTRMSQVAQQQPTGATSAILSAPYRRPCTPVEVKRVALCYMSITIPTIGLLMALDTGMPVLSFEWKVEVGTITMTPAGLLQCCSWPSLNCTEQRRTPSYPAQLRSSRELGLRAKTLSNELNAISIPNLAVRSNGPSWLGPTIAFNLPFTSYHRGIVTSLNDEGSSRFCYKVQLGWDVCFWSQRR
jgi:hypothetical protein